MLNNQERATVLCALRLMQSELNKIGGADHIKQCEHFKHASPLDKKQIDDLCEMITASEHKGCLPIQDWRVEHDPASLAPGDDIKYKLEYQLGNQMYLRIIDAHETTQMNIIVEINNGVPAIHISDRADDELLHIHRAQGGLVLTPDSRESTFKSSSLDRFSYKDANSLTIK
ncbi:MAG: hypothetical protein QNL62_04150 [Gammaproteobacteria bacterium]|nr:hypothetical protein [Gammaproteobacteria bacterium]